MRRLALFFVLGLLLVLAFGVQPVSASDITTIVINSPHTYPEHGNVYFSDLSNGTEPPPPHIVIYKDGNIFKIVSQSY